MNIFEMLDVEDITDENLVASGLKSHHAKAIPKRAPLETYELDSDLDIDVPFIVFCFFEDLHRVQEFVNDTWKSHKSGSMDIGAAYLLTNYAVTIVSALTRIWAFGNSHIASPMPYSSFGSKSDCFCRFNKKKREL